MLKHCSESRSYKSRGTLCANVGMAPRALPPALGTRPSSLPFPLFPGISSQEVKEDGARFL